MNLLKRDPWRRLAHLPRLLNPEFRQTVESQFLWTLEKTWDRFVEHRPVPDITKTILLCGSMRGGTSVLARCIASHPQVRHFGFELSAAWSHFGDVQCLATFLPHTECPPLTAADATPDRVRRLRQGFARMFARRGGKQGDWFLAKNPHLANKMFFVREVFPSAALVITSRDVRSTVASLKQIHASIYRSSGWRWYLPPERDACFRFQRPGDDPDRCFPGGRASVYAEYWLNVYESLDAACTLFPRVSIVRHSAFCKDPQSTLARVFKETELPPAPIHLPVAIKSDRHTRWGSILTEAEQVDLERFIEANRVRLRALQTASWEV